MKEEERRSREMKEEERRSRELGGDKEKLGVEPGKKKKGKNPRKERFRAEVMPVAAQEENGRIGEAL